MSIDQLKAALAPVLDVVTAIDPADKNARALLDKKLPLSGFGELRALVRRGVDEGWLCDRATPDGMRFSRVQKANEANTHSIDAVHMSGAGPEHTHPSGEIDLCFALDKGAQFDGNDEGWTVYGPGSRHVPTVTGGRMDILYFLPGGKIEF